MNLSITLKPRAIIMYVLILTLLVITGKTSGLIIKNYHNERLSLEAENAELRAENKVLLSRVENLELNRESLIAKTNALIAENEEKDVFIISRGSSELSERLKGISYDDFVAVKQLELENEALRLFYKNTTGYEIKEIRWTKIESTMYATWGGAYSKDDPNYGLMASGEFVHHGAVAAPSDVPFGTTVLFDNSDLKYDIGNRIFTVKDRGGLIVNNNGRVCIDIWMEDGSENVMADWGRNKSTSGFLIIPAK